MHLRNAYKIKNFKVGSWQGRKKSVHSDYTELHVQTAYSVIQKSSENKGVEINGKLPKRD